MLGIFQVISDVVSFICDAANFLLVADVAIRFIPSADRLLLSQSDEAFVTKRQEMPRLPELAAAGDPVSQYKLGKAYADGIDVKRDLAQAFTWCLKAANQGYTNAQSTIGKMYFMGEGTSRDFEESYFWYSVAAMGGKPKEWPETVAKYLKPDQISAIGKRVAEWQPSKM